MRISRLLGRSGKFSATIAGITTTSVISATSGRLAISLAGEILTLIFAEVVLGIIGASLFGVARTMALSRSILGSNRASVGSTFGSMRDRTSATGATFSGSRVSRVSRLSIVRLPRLRKLPRS